MKNIKTEIQRNQFATRLQGNVQDAIKMITRWITVMDQDQELVLIKSTNVVQQENANQIVRNKQH